MKQPDLVHEQLIVEHGLARELLKAERLDEAAPVFIRQVAGLLGWEAGAIWEVMSPDEPLRFVRGWEARSPDLEPLWEMSRALRLTRGIGLPGRAWDSGEITWIPALEADENFPRLSVARRLGLAAGLAIPVPVGEPAGVLAVAEFFTKAHEPPDREVIDLSSGFSDQLAIFISRARATASASEQRTLFAAVVESTHDAVYSKDLDGLITSWNRGAKEMYGYGFSEVIGRHVSLLVPEDHRHEETRILDRIKRGERIETYETERIRKDGSRIDVSLTVAPIGTPVLGIVGASVVARDITLMKRRRDAEAFLAKAASELDTSLDPLATARSIAETAVPDLAEMCVIDLGWSEGLIGETVVAATDPSLAKELEGIRARDPLDPDGDHPVARTLRARRPLVFRDLTNPRILSAVAQSDEHLALIRKAGYSSAAVVPMIARGRRLGAVSFLHLQNDRRYEESELELLADLGDRAAIALDNAYLYAERDRVARTLQRGLRPEHPAVIPGVETAVVFEAAGRGIEVGGDFYDLFETPDGWLALVGDVAGKGSEAATFTAKIRHSIRALVLDRWQPDAVLDRLNSLLMESETDGRFASAILAKLVRDGQDLRVDLSGAGHPPAVLLTDRGSILLGRGPLLGLWPDAHFRLDSGHLSHGDTMVIYTDGLLEAGEVRDHISYEELAEHVAHWRGRAANRVAEDLRADALQRSGGQLQDDLVVLALHRPLAPNATRAN